MEKKENIINESNRIKDEVCNNCKSQLKGALSDNDLQIFEDIFYKVASGYVLREKRGLNQ